MSTSKVPDKDTSKSMEVRGLSTPIPRVVQLLCSVPGPYTVSTHIWKLRLRTNTIFIFHSLQIVAVPVRSGHGALSSCTSSCCLVENNTDEDHHWTVLGD